MEMIPRCFLSLPSPPPESGTKLRPALTAACQAPISMLVHGPSPCLGLMQPYTKQPHADGARASEAEQVEGPAVLGALLISGPGRAQPASQLPTGIYRARPGKVPAEACPHSPFPSQ